MTWTIVVTPRSKAVEKCFDLFAQTQEAFIKDIKMMVAVSSFYDVFCPQLDRINKLIEERFPNLFFIRADFKKHEVTGRYAVVLRRHPQVTLKRLNGSFEISIEGKNGDRQ